MKKMSASSKLVFRRHETEISRQLNLVLQESALDNHYSLHPRRLAELGPELARSLVTFVEDAERDLESVGRNLASEGVGQKTLARISTRIRRVVASLQDVGIESLDAVDAFVESLLIGFITAHEEQILKSQEDLRRALAEAREGMGT